MTGNPLLQELDQFGEVIGTTNGIMYQLVSHLNDYKKVLKERFQPLMGKMKQPLLETTLVIGDLTGNSDKGKINFPTDYAFELRLEEIDQKINLLIDREAMRNIAFTFEVLETFTLDIVSKFLFLNKIQYNEVIAKKLKPKGEGLDDYRDAIRNLRGRNMREILSLLRMISAHFREAETQNHEGINLRDWIETLSQVRHGIIHSNFKLKKSIIEQLTSDQKDILFKYFPIREHESHYELIIDSNCATRTFDLIAEYGLLVFKSLSIEQDYDWRVFRYMDGPPESLIATIASNRK